MTGQLDPIEEIIERPLEEMDAPDLVRYILLYQEHVNDIAQEQEGWSEIAALRGFKDFYGPEKAARIIRHIFLSKGGRIKVTDEEEFIRPRHFVKGMRWWTDKVASSMKRHEVAREQVSDFNFSSELK